MIGKETMQLHSLCSGRLETSTKHLMADLITTRMSCPDLLSSIASSILDYASPEGAYP